MGISETIRKSVDSAIADGETRYSIAKAAGVDYRTFARFLDEDRDVRSSTLDALASHLGLAMVVIDSLPSDHPARKAGGKKRKT